MKAIRHAEHIVYNSRPTKGHQARIPIEIHELLAQLYVSMGQTCQSKAASEEMDSVAQEYFEKALDVHVNILRLVVCEHVRVGDTDDELDTLAYFPAEEGSDIQKQGKQTIVALDVENIDRSAVAFRHLQLLKLAYQRLGGWPKSYNEYGRLIAKVFSIYGTDTKWMGVQNPEKWSAQGFGNGVAESQHGAFRDVAVWAL
jgi:hypothetical protein